MALVVMVSLVGAETIIAGTSFSFESEQFEYYDIVGNLSSTEGMTIDWADGETVISFDKNYQPDSFTLIMYNNEQEVIVEYHYSGGGGSGGGTRTVYRDRNVTEYVYEDVPVDVVTEVSGETEFTSVVPFWVYVLLLLLIAIILFLFFTREKQEEINGSEMPKV